MKRYASMPDWMYDWFEITAYIDNTCFRQHDHDYGCAGHTFGDWTRAITRSEADRVLRKRLIAYGMKPRHAWLIWLGCRVIMGKQWRSACNNK